MANCNDNVNRHLSKLNHLPTFWTMPFPPTPSTSVILTESERLQEFGRVEVEPRCGRPSTQAKSQAQPRELRRIPALYPTPCRIREFSPTAASGFSLCRYQGAALAVPYALNQAGFSPAHQWIAGLKKAGCPSFHAVCERCKKLINRLRGGLKSTKSYLRRRLL